MPHPYEAYENMEMWKVLGRSIQQLAQNSDITLRTGRRYVVEYLCQQRSELPPRVPGRE